VTEVAVKADGTRGGRGYITHAFNSGSVDYLRMAYCLALSLRLTQSAVSGLTVVVGEGDRVPPAYEEAFDHVVRLRSDLSSPGGWRVHNYCQLYDASPYEETVTLDSDMLFFADVSGWWESLAGRDIVAATALTYRGVPIEDNPLRADFYAAGLPDLHNGFLYFREGPTAARVFETMKELTRDWEGLSPRYFGRSGVHFSSDGALLCALRATGCERSADNADLGGIPNFVHMKACMQGWSGVPRSERDWRRYAAYRFADDLGAIEVAGVRVTAPFHYHVRDFVDDGLLAAYHRRLAEVG